MEQDILFSIVLGIIACITVIVLALVVIHLTKILEKSDAKVKKIKLHAGKHQWFEIECK